MAAETTTARRVWSWRRLVIAYGVLAVVGIGGGLWGGSWAGPVLAAGAAFVLTWATRWRGKSRLLGALAYVCYVLIVAEVTARGYFAVARGANVFMSTADLPLLWFEHLPPADSYRERPDNVDILLLGGSVISDKFRVVPEHLPPTLSELLDRPVHLVNVAQSAHGIVDSHAKYTLLADQRFDLVIVYHGINDTVQNNCPPDVFREDYRHTAWYTEVGSMIDHPSWYRGGSFVPAFAASLFGSIRSSLAGMPTGRLASRRAEWRPYGAEIKSAATFERHLRAICELADRRGDSLLLATFALNTDTGRGPNEGCLWGTGTNVARGVAAHNRIIEKVAAEHGLPVVPLAERLQGAENFTDECHLTERGGEVFAREIVVWLRNGGAQRLGLPPLSPP